MPPCSCPERHELRWLHDDYRHDLLTPILEEYFHDYDECHDDPSSFPVWKYVLCGVPIGMAAPMTVRACCLWFLGNTNTIPSQPPSAVYTARVSLLIYAMGLLVLLTNAFYLYVTLTKKAREAKKETATMGIMIGCCFAWTILDVVWYNMVDMLPLVLIVMYTCALWKICKNQSGQGKDDDACSFV